jgi:hypothetical protein
MSTILFRVLTLSIAIVVVACGADTIAPAEPSATVAASVTVAATATDPPTSSPTATATTEPPSPTVEPVSKFPQLGSPTGVETTFRSPEFDALPGATAEFGELGRSVYRIEVPDDWNGELVMWAHGFRGFDTEVRVSLPGFGMRELLIEEGYAWAASSYSENGYVPGIGADDTLALKQYFEETYGDASQTYIVGGSMGGNVVVLSLERFGGVYDAGLAYCGAVGGQEQIDYLVSWLAVAEFVTQTEVPIGGGLLAVSSVLLGQIFPALGTPEDPTPAGQQLKSVMLELSGGPRPFFDEGYAAQFETNTGYILSDPDRESLITLAATNAGVVYSINESLGLTAAELNEGVRRLIADADSRNAENHPDAVPTSGLLTSPLLSVHNSGDVFVPIQMEIDYRAKADALGVGDLLVQRVVRSGGHCTFTEAEVQAAWHDLVAWVEDGTVPDGDDLSDLTTAGLKFTLPLRDGDPLGN